MTSNLFDALEEIPDDGDGITNWLGSLQTSGSTIGTVATTEQSARSGRNSANTTTLNDLKATLKTERETAEKVADRLYRNTEQGAWNTYLTGVQNANTAYLTSQKTAENTYKTAADAADATYRAASVTAYTNYHQSIHALDTAFYAAVADACDANFTTTAYFTSTGANGSLSYQKTVNTEPSESLFGEVFVMPWNPAANLSFWDNLKMYGRMGGKAATGTASGATGGAVTGGVTGAVLGGATTGGLGVVPGALTGAGGGAITGGVSGFLGAAFATPEESFEKIVEDGLKSGATMGLPGGILVKGSSLGVVATKYAYNHKVKATLPATLLATEISVVLYGNDLRVIQNQDLSSPSEEQLQVIYEALDIIQKSEFHGYIPHSIAIINDEANSGAPWGYAPFVGGDIYLNSKLLELPPKLVASTIVHEVTHRRRGRFTAGMYEEEAYQTQSNFLRTVGITGTISEIYKKDASMKAPKPTAFLIDLKEAFKELNIHKATIF